MREVVEVAGQVACYIIVTVGCIYLTLGLYIIRF
jgi:hypothetical protein